VEKKQVGLEMEYRKMNNKNPVLLPRSNRTAKANS
jgi:hypothetical protein